MKVMLPVGLIMLMVTQAGANHGLLKWQFPRAASPQPSSFTITYAHSATPAAGLQQMTVPPSAPGACETVPEDDDTYCALWPACPAAGEVLMFWVQAVYPDGVVSGQSNTLLCQFVAAQPCVCLDPGQEPPPTPAVAVMPPPTPAVAVMPPPSAAGPDALTSILSLVPAAPA